MNKAPIFGAMACAVVAAVIGYLIIPGPLEQVTMLMRDGRDDAALEKADALIEAGHREPGLLMQTFLLNERYGNSERGMAALRAYFQASPNDAEAWRKAASTFAKTHNLEAQIDALEHLVNLTHEPPAVSGLARVYRLHARFDDELRVLQSVDAAHLEAADTVRLASLLLGRNDLAQAASLLRKLDDQKKITTNDERMMLFGALVDQSNFDEAARRAVDWGVYKEVADLQDVFVGYLLRQGADGPALRLAMQTNTIADPRKMTHLAQLLSDEGRYDLLENVVFQWLSYARQLPADGLDGYFRVVVDIGRQKGLDSQLFHQLLFALERRGSASVKASFLQAMYNQYGYVGIAPYRGSLGADVLAARPILAARVLLQEHNLMASRHFLLQSNLFTLSAQDRFDWLSTAQVVLQPDELIAEISHRANAAAIPHEMKRAIIEIALRQATQPELAAIWATFFKVQEQVVAKDEQVSSIR
jgi:hypothetical protein